MKRILVGAAILLLAPVAVLLSGVEYVSYKAASSRIQNKTAAVGIARDISKTWSVQGLEHRISPAQLEAFASPACQETLRQLSHLGILVKVSDLTQTAYKVSTELGSTATVTFHGQFENGTSDVSLVLIEDGNELKLVKLKLREATPGRVASGPARGAAGTLECG
jgi:hypothetical protein